MVTFVVEIFEKSNITNAQNIEKTFFFFFFFFFNEMNMTNLQVHEIYIN